MTRYQKNLHLDTRPNITPSAIIVVMPGLLCRQAASQAGGSALACVTRSLNDFQGDACGIVMDSDILQIADHADMTDALRRLFDRTKVHAAVHTDRIDERDRDCSSLAIAQEFILRMDLNAKRDTIRLTGAGWDRTDQPTDLLAYAFRGLGFTTLLDPSLCLPQKAA